jgi:phenylpropionate dioxygenase-like ring-hydroxylating dioxygenase large terminal subunit
MSSASYALNLWYQAGWSEELAVGGSLARTIAEIPVLFFRRSDDSLSALLDRCPHRFAPLSKGCVENDVVQCGYHGLVFDHEGQCVENPYGPVLKSMRVPAYPVVERHDAIWVWLGDAAMADPADIRDLSFIDDTPETAKFRGYLHSKANYQLLNDNILDLYHTGYLHADSIGGLFPETVMAAEETDDRVKVSWTSENVPSNATFRARGGASDRMDQRVEVIWSKPGVMTLDATEVAAGATVNFEDHIVALHSMTPETPTTSHYFYCATRRYDMDNAGMTELIRSLATKAFVDEDKPMLEAQQQRVGEADFWELKPLLLPIDKAAVLARRKLEKLIAAEDGGR